MPFSRRRAPTKSMKGSAMASSFRKISDSARCRNRRLVFAKAGNDHAADRAASEYVSSHRLLDIARDAVQTVDAVREQRT